MEKLALPMLPYIFALIVSISVWVMVWMRRHTGGAAALLWFIFAGNLYALLIALELVSATVNLKLIWGSIRFLVTAFGPFSLLYFSYRFTQRRIKSPKISWGLLLAWPIIFTILLITNQYHELIYPPGAITLVAENALLGYEMPLISWLLIYYSFAIAVFSIFLIVLHFLAVRRIFRLQIATLLLGVFLPQFGTILSLLQVKLLDRWDPSFFLLIIGNLILAWGLYRYQLFDIVPIAREVLIENIHDGVLVLDEQLRVVDINPIALDYLNLAEMEVIGNDVSIILPAEKNEIQNLTGNGFLLEIQLANGERKRDIEIKSVQLEDVSGNATGRLLVLYDITEKKQAKQELEAANEQLTGLNARLQNTNNELEKLSQAKDKFIANISHELRSPLNNIRLNHDLLSMRPASSEKYLDVLRRETERLTRLVEDLLMVSRIEQQQIQPKKSPFDLNQLLTEFFTDRQALAQERGLSMSLVLDETIPFALADRAMISYTISSLLTNAINFTPAGGMITMASHQRSKMENAWVGFSITDTGIGILPEEQTKIFTRFVRGAAVPDNIPGTGLGLAAVKELVELHRGEIQLTSTGIPGEGSQFLIWLPVCDG